MMQRAACDAVFGRRRRSWNSIRPDAGVPDLGRKARADDAMHQCGASAARGAQAADSAPAVDGGVHFFRFRNLSMANW